MKTINKDLNKLIPIAEELLNMEVPLFQSPVSAGFPSEAYNYVEKGFINQAARLLIQAIGFPNQAAASKPSKGRADTLLITPQNASKRVLLRIPKEPAR